MESPSPSPLPCCAPTPFFQYECWLTFFGNTSFTYAQMLSVGQKSQRRPGACEGGSESVCFQIVKDFKIRKKWKFSIILRIGVFFEWTVVRVSAHSHGSSYISLKILLLAPKVREGLLNFEVPQELLYFPSFFSAIPGVKCNTA